FNILDINHQKQEDMENKKLAAIDIGTNSIHMVVVFIKDNGNFEIVNREKEVIRLGEGSKGDIKHLKPEAMLRAVNVLKSFKAIADSHNATIRAVATSAAREAGNKKEFLSMVEKETGIEVEIVGGQEEARLIYLGVLKAVPVFDQQVLSIDIGGGSTEFTLGIKGKVLYSRSLKLGAVRLTNKYFPDYLLKKKKLKDCRRWIDGTIHPVFREIQEFGYDICVGTSGTIMTAGNMIHLRHANGNNGTLTNNNYDFTRDEVFQVLDEVLKNKTVEERSKLPGLDFRRAEIFPAGLLIIASIFDLFKLKSMKISNYALREGIIIDTLQKSNIKSLDPDLRDIRNMSVEQLAASCRFDRKHCEHVASLSQQLFDQLKDLHKLDDECSEYLKAGAKLHDIGYHISHSSHHKHSDYIIRNSELLGFNQNEIAIIANIARYHRKSHPKKRHKDYFLLSPKTRDIIRRLAALLRVADSLDRSHAKKIMRIDVSNTKDAVILNINNLNGDLNLEIWDFERRKGLFEEVFGKKILLRKNIESVTEIKSVSVHKLSKMETSAYPR
ncbi:MAG: hypothetical protein A2161_13120, partial [Candidatus Schekmanbacteria bacterium RBG_13_48_7]